MIHYFTLHIRNSWVPCSYIQYTWKKMMITTSVEWRISHHLLRNMLVYMILYPQNVYEQSSILAFFIFCHCFSHLNTCVLRHYDISSPLALAQFSSHLHICFHLITHYHIIHSLYIPFHSLQLARFTQLSLFNSSFHHLIIIPYTNITFDSLPSICYQIYYTILFLFHNISAINHFY